MQMPVFRRVAALAVLLAAAPRGTFAQSPTPPVVDIRDLTPREHVVAGFVLTAPQELRITAVGAEPRPDRRDDREGWWNNSDERNTWPAAAWILDARTRQVVWDLRTADTERSRDGLRRFAGTVRLPAGLYEAHFASYVADWISTGENVGSFLRGFVSRNRQEPRYGGYYVDHGAFREFAFAIAGGGARPAPDRELAAASQAYRATAIATLRPERSSSARAGFELAAPTDVEVAAIGEVRRDGAFDYGWIIDATTHKTVWRMDYRNTAPAGGAQKNRAAHETLHLPAGRYAAYFMSDDTHDPEEWNGVPAFDPEFWGLTLRVTDAAARARVRAFEYTPVPAQTLVSLVGIGDRASKSAGFTLRRPLDVHVYAIGEGVNEEMTDYAWIVDAGTHHRVWTMRYDDTEDAGGADKNRLFDGTLHLEAGSYLVYYTSDGSHSAEEWNAAPPAEAGYWGVSVFPESGRIDPAVAGPFVQPPKGAVLAELVRMGNDARARTTFHLDQDAPVRIYALGEGSGEMYDYASIVDEATGRTVWEMSYDETDPAGGARKNRVFDGTVRLTAGSYTLRYRSDGSHSYEDWNDDPPDDPGAWGVTIYKVGNR